MWNNSLTWQKAVPYVPINQSLMEIRGITWLGVIRSHRTRKQRRRHQQQKGLKFSVGGNGHTILNALPALAASHIALATGYLWMSPRIKFASAYNSKVSSKFHPQQGCLTSGPGAGSIPTPAHPNVSVVPILYTEVVNFLKKNEVDIALSSCPAQCPIWKAKFSLRKHQI